MATKNRIEKRGGMNYLYRITPYWDKELKQGRQKKEYIGPCDENGNIIEERRRDCNTTDTVVYRSVIMGPYDLLYRISERMGLRERLARQFSEDDAIQLISMAILRITDPDSLRTICDTIESTSLEFQIGPGSYRSQRLSEFLEDIGKNDSARNLFYESCLQSDDVVVFDTSVLQSSSKLMDSLEYGRNAKKTGLPQVNLGLVHSLNTGLPVMMKLYPGSISDVSTVKGLIGRLRSMGSKSISLVMDRGFYSESNMVFLESSPDCEFLMPLKSSTDLYKDVITSAKADLENPVNMFMFHGRTESYSDMEIEWPYVTEAVGPDGSVIENLRVLVFVNTEREKDETNTFISKVEEAERLASQTEWKDDGSSTYDIFRGSLEGMETLFDITKGDNGKVSLSRKRNAMTFAMRNFGKIALVTNMKSAPKEILERYRTRDEDEKEFETLKDDMEGGIKYVHCLDAAKGLLFIQFIALSLRMYLRQSLDKDMKALGIPVILKRMRSVTASKLRTGWVINEIPKKCRDIYEHLGVDLPTGSLLVDNTRA